MLDLRARGSSRDVTEGSLSRRTRNALDLRMIVPVLAGCAAGGPGRSSACACPRWRSFLSWPGRWCGRGGSRPLARMPRGPRCWCPSPSSAQWPLGRGGPGCHDPVDGVCRRAADLAAAGHRDRAGGGRGGGGRCVRRWFRLPYTDHRTDVWGLLLQRQAEGSSAAPVFTDGSRRAAVRPDRAPSAVDACGRPSQG